MRWRCLALSGALLVGLSAPAGAARDPGRLPQTATRPPVSTLTSRLTPLFRALVSGDAGRARAAFFPRQAYLQMKDHVLPNAAADYQDRLIGLFDLDVAAYHRLLLTGGSPTLVRVSATTADAAWIAPGACENTIGYWHLPGVRFLYRHGTRLYSVAIDSLISWRGVWYVVHLGPNPRPVDVGTVDGYRAGPGQPGPPGGC